MNTAGKREMARLHKMTFHWRCRFVSSSTNTRCVLKLSRHCRYSKYVTTMTREHFPKWLLPVYTFDGLLNPTTFFYKYKKYIYIYILFCAWGKQKFVLITLYCATLRPGIFGQYEMDDWSSTQSLPCHLHLNISPLEIAGWHFLLKYGSLRKV